MESSETIQSERLGAVLVEKNLITDEQLERALVLQEESGKRLGEILVAEFGVSRLEVAGVLSEQWAGVEKPELETAKPIEPLTPAEVHLRRPLGELLVIRGVITPDQLDAALEEQRRSGARIGEILVERGAVSRLDLAAALSDYGSPAGGPPSPGFVAGPQPSHDGSLGASPSAQGWSVDGLALVSDLEARLQTLERAAGGAPWQEDLRLVAFDIRAAISAVEARLEASGPSPGEAELVAALGAVSTRIDALENAPVSAELEALRQELEELKAGPVTMEEIAELRATVERLEALPDRADEIPRLASEIAVLAARSDEFAARVDEIVLPVAGLSPRIDGLSARVEEVAAAIPVVETDALVARIELLEEGSRAGGGTLEQLAGEVAALAARFAEVPDAGELSGRLEAVAEKAVFAQKGVAGLAGRVDELAASVPSGEVIEELRRELSGLAARAEAADGAELGAAVASLAARLDEFAARVDEIVLPVAGLSPRIDGLSARVEEVAAAIPVVETDALVARIELLEEGSRAGGGTLEQLAGEVAALAARFAEVPDAGELSGRLEAVAEKAVFAQKGVAGLAGRVDELAASVPSGEVIEELRRELSGLAARAEAADGAELGAAVASLAARLDEFAARVDEIVLPVAGLSPRIDGLSARVEEVAAAIPVVETDALVARIELLEEGSRAGGGTLEQLAGEVAALAARFAEVPDAGELSGRLEAVAEKAVFAQKGVAGLAGRVDELAASVPSGEVIEELRRELSGLAARAEAADGAELGAAVASLAARLDEFAARVDEIVLPVAGLSPRIDGLSARVEEVAAAIPVVETDALVARIELLEEGSRAGGGTLEHLAGETNELRSQLQELTITSARDESVALLEARVGELEHRVAATAELRDEIQRIGASASAGRDSLAHALFARVEEIVATVPAADEVIELRLRVDELASRPMEDHVLQARVGELAARIEGLALVEATVADLTASVAGLDGRIDSCVRDGHDRVDGLAEELSMRIGGLAKELSRRIDSVVARADGFVSRDQAEATAAEQAAWIRDELEVLREWTNVHAAAVDVALAGADDARVTGQQELGNRIDEAAGALRADAEAQARELEARLGASASETAALRARVDALQESAADRIGWEARLESMLEQSLDDLAARITDEVAGARADAEHAADAVRGKTDSLGGRIDELHGLHHAHLQDVRDATERLVERVEAESGLRAGDAEASRAAEAELCARVDEHAMRSAAAVFEIEQRLQEEIGCLAAQLEERDASGIEARDELRVELERVASSMGWRLERIEESLAADDGAELNATVAELGRRLDEQAAIAEEQARATERALRKGLAALGERLVDTESAYADAGKALRRSIERLGAAVVEADARMADQIPVSEAEGCVAFAPTAAGYRLVELPGTPPEIGSTLELDVCEGPLVVTRYGSSPLPLDSRSCAYLERA